MDSVSVKLNYYGDLRRFSFVPLSIQALIEQITSVLNIEANQELVVKYLDEEGDLITLTSDLELKSAVAPSSVLRLFVTLKSGGPSTVPPPVVPSAPVVAQGNAPVAMDVEQVHLYPQVPPFGGYFRGRPGIGGPHGGPHGPYGPRFFGGRHGGFGFGGFRRHLEDAQGDNTFCGKRGRRGAFKAWWDNEDHEALMKSNEQLVEQVAQMGFGLPKEKILKMILKTQWKCDMYGKKLGPNDTVILSHVVRKLNWKKERKERKASARSERKEKKEDK